MRRLSISIVVVALLGIGLYWFSRPKPLPVTLTEVAEGKVEATLANTRAGTVEACQRTKLSTIIGGRIEYLGVKEGDKVKKGQVLVRLHDDVEAAVVAGARADVAAAQASPLLGPATTLERSRRSMTGTFVAVCSPHCSNASSIHG